MCGAGDCHDSTKENWLVVWTINFIFQYVLGITILTDFHFFQRGGSTTTQRMMVNGLDGNDDHLITMVMTMTNDDNQLQISFFRMHP